MKHATMIYNVQWSLLTLPVTGLRRCASVPKVIYRCWTCVFMVTQETSFFMCFWFYHKQLHEMNIKFRVQSVFELWCRRVIISHVEYLIITSEESFFLLKKTKHLKCENQRPGTVCFWNWFSHVILLDNLIFILYIIKLEVSYFRHFIKQN